MIRFKNTFPLDEKKKLSLAEMSKKKIKKVFPLARKSLSTYSNAFKNAFSLKRKTKLAVAGVSQNERKKWFPLATKSVSTSRNKVIFQKFDLPVYYELKRISK